MHVLNVRWRSSNPARVGESRRRLKNLNMSLLPTLRNNALRCPGTNGSFAVGVLGLSDLIRKIRIYTPFGETVSSIEAHWITGHGKRAGASFFTIERVRCLLTEWTNHQIVVPEMIR
jgi:hypothetical protein